MITLKTLHEATTYEVVKQAGIHLLRQNKKSQSYGSCMYRDGQGLKCAAGCFIANDEYDDRFEETSWESLVDEHKVPAYHVGVIQRLQLIHDEYEVEQWPSKLEELCAQLDIDSGWIQEEANEVIENLPGGVLEASIEGGEVPAEKDEDVISTARSLGVEFAKAKFPKLKEILASVAVKEAEKHPDEDREAFIRQYIRAVFDVFNDLYAS